MREINEYLLKLGFVSNLKGSVYLRDALKLQFQSKKLCNLKSEIYPTIAKKYNVSVLSVEKNICNAIDKVWLCADLEVLCKNFGHIIDEGRGKPTIKEFLANSVEIIQKQSNISKTSSF